MLHLPSPPPGGWHAARQRVAAGRAPLAPAEQHRLRVHLSDSTATVCVDSGLRFIRRRGDIDVVPAHAPGGFHAEQGYEVLEVGVSGEWLQQVAEAAGRGDGRLTTRHMLRDLPLTQLALAVDDELRDGVPSGALYLQGLGVALAARLLTRHGSARAAMPGVVDPRLQGVLDVIDAHLDGVLTLDRLARVAGMSRAQLQREFRRCTGQSVHQYVVRRRVARARVLLAQGALPASQVALAAGFAHQSHMARWIRRVGAEG